MTRAKHAIKSVAGRRSRNNFSFVGLIAGLPNTIVVQ
jgi:hypothetical protein